MSDERWFYRHEQEWIAIVECLKQTPCPHCKTVGTLNRHGVLRGFDDSNPQRKTIRARRVFCSNRKHRPGCGRTVSVWIANKIRRLSISTRTLWTFLQHAVVSTITDLLPEQNTPRNLARGYGREFPTSRSDRFQGFLGFGEKWLAAAGVNRRSVRVPLGVREGHSSNSVNTTPLDVGIAFRFWASNGL